MRGGKVALFTFRRLEVMIQPAITRVISGFASANSLQNVRFVKSYAFTRHRDIRVLVNLALHDSYVVTGPIPHHIMALQGLFDDRGSQGG